MDWRTILTLAGALGLGGLVVYLLMREGGSESSEVADTVEDQTSEIAEQDADAEGSVVEVMQSDAPEVE